MTFDGRFGKENTIHKPHPQPTEPKGSIAMAQVLDIPGYSQIVRVYGLAGSKRGLSRTGE